jgi:hypothetical protein
MAGVVVRPPGAQAVAVTGAQRPWPARLMWSALLRGTGALDVCGTGPRSARGVGPVPPLGWVSSASGSAGGPLSASSAVVDQPTPGRWAPRSDGRLAAYGTPHDEERPDAPHPPPLRLLQYYDAPRL